MNHQENEKAENLRELLRQHWLHCRHLESERAWFMSVYAAITGGMFSFMAYTGLQTSWPLYFLIGLTFFGFFHTIRWTYAFECHRKKVNELAWIVWLDSGVEVKSALDPTMEIPPMRIIPDSRCGKKINELFRTRYWFPLFYFFILVGLAILSCVAGLGVWCKVIASVASGIAFLIGVGWCFSLKKIKLEKQRNDNS